MVESSKFPADGEENTSRKTKQGSKDSVMRVEMRRRASPLDVREPHAPVAVVGIGASAGGVQVLQQLFGTIPNTTDLAFVVVMHLSPDHTSNLAEILQSRTGMLVIQVTETMKVEKNHVYVIPPNKHLSMNDGMLVLSEPQQETGRRVTIDLFFRTLAEHWGQRALCIILSGTDSDGVIGLKHIKAQGGVTIAQEPSEAEHDSMPRHAIETGMVDWVLPVHAMPDRLLDYVKNERAITLPPEHDGEEEAQADLGEDVPGGALVAKETRDPDDESALHEVLRFLRSQTGHDFSHYKRTTVLRRIARRLQVNSLETLPSYLAFLQTHSGESQALLHDLLISVTHFFRDAAVFAALEANVPQLFAGKGPNDEIRAWVPGCATGEEAYSVAILLCEMANRLEKPPTIQIFATDVDEEAVRKAREGIYPTTVEADVSRERLQRYFFEHHGQYRIKKDVRELILFAPHDLLRDSPFSRLDLISCRNLLIYLKPEAQQRALDIFHFGLRAGGVLVLGSAEGVDGGHALFAGLDKHNRIYVRRNTVRLPMVQLLPKPAWRKPIKETLLPRLSFPAGALESRAPEGFPPPVSPVQQRLESLGEAHVRLIERHGPASMIVNEDYDIIHMSAKAATYLRFTGGEPSANLLRLVDESLRLELRTALFRATKSGEDVSISGVRTQRDGKVHLVDFHVWPARESVDTAPLFLVMLEERRTLEKNSAELTTPQQHEPVTRHLEEELRQTRAQLNSTVEHYETIHEELNAANEELQAINEELRSSTEELETSKEELQSVNEELTTLNHELKSNIEELNRANGDLQNLIVSTDMATVFLDEDLRIKRYTPRAQELFNIIPSDLGRRLFDITSKIHYPQLVEDVEKVGRTLGKIEREVQGPGNSAFLARVSPYRSWDDRISGVVLVFVDITVGKQAREALKKGEEEFRRGIEEAPIPMIMQAEDGQVLQISRSWTELTGYSHEDIPTFDSWLNKAYGFGGEDVREKMRLSFHGKVPLEQVEFDLITRKGHRRSWSFSASPIGILRDGRRFIVGMALDITDRKQSAEELRQAHDELEQRVVERTRDLVAMNTELKRTMAQRRLLEKELLEISERERRRIGDDLHDVICQDLTATALLLTSSANKVKEKGANKMLNEAARIVNRNVGVARDLARGLQPVQMSSGGGLSDALRGLCAKAKDRINVKCNVKLSRQIRIHDETMALNLFRIAQEGVENAVKHSHASEIAIYLRREGDSAMLVVQDNGKGIRTKKRGKGLGLHLMRYRASVLNGELTIETPPGGGTKIVATVPLPKKKKRK